MNSITADRITWKELLNTEKPVLLPVAHDALTARIIERAGFKGYQIGGFALAASMHAVPDVDLEHFGEKGMAARNIIGASSLPVMVDADDGYGDVKNVTRTVQEYIRMGISAIFIEDQKLPIKCGHMGDKHVIESEKMQDKMLDKITELELMHIETLDRIEILDKNHDMSLRSILEMDKNVKRLVEEKG